ncbi:deoxyribonuclease, partial [Lactobacillus fermentum]|nr:deoxyribonuclease [Limosilactobacillus fermentum]
MRTHFRKRRFRGSSPLERLMILVAIAALLGVVIGLALPKISPSIGEITGEYIASGPAADALN